MPIGEIIYDFFDALKARTKGYASLDYEFFGLPPLRPGEGGTSPQRGSRWTPCPSSSTGKGLRPGPEDLRKAQGEHPRQLFEVPVQAAIGGKIIARETVKAMRKDVLAKCYGGDISRKKKLLEKQKEGKKKMRTLGTVQLPTEAFMAVLKLDE